jgi:hypothetical protein
MQGNQAKEQWSSFSYCDMSFDFAQGKAVPRWVLLLPGAGCEWYKKTGGCTMCGFNQSTRLYTLGGRLLPSFVFNFLYWLGGRKARRVKPEQLTIYNGGSFLSDREIPLAFQLGVCEKVARHENLGSLLVESRAEFVTEGKLDQFLALLGGKKLWVAIGLECVTDEIRNRYFRKGLSRESFERAVKLLRDKGCSVLAYVFLKPLYLKEGEAIEEAVKTIEYAFRVGVSEVALECAFVQQGTAAEISYRRGEFRPPRLWSVIEVAQRARSLGPVRIGGFSDEPPPIAIPENCPVCTPLVANAIDEYRRTNDIRFLDGLTCGCRDDWKKEIQSP